MVTDTSNRLRPTEVAYKALLSLPLTDEWRALNQSVYVTLRDEIAADWQWDAERVQAHFEEIAAMRDAPTSNGGRASVDDSDAGIVGRKLPPSPEILNDLAKELEYIRSRISETASQVLSLRYGDSAYSSLSNINTRLYDVMNKMRAK